MLKIVIIDIHKLIPEAITNYLQQYFFNMKGSKGQSSRKTLRTVN